MVDWAPRNVPLERRLQTATVAGWWLMMLVFLMINISCLMMPVTYPVYIPYLIWVYAADFDTPKNGVGRKRMWVRKLPYFKYFADYFPVTLHKTADLDPKHNYLFAYHPHGIIAYGVLGCFATEARNFSEVYPGIDIHPCTLDTNFRSPLSRELFLGLGMISVGKRSLINCLSPKRPGNSALIVVGGAAEALDAHPGTYELTLARRKGFCKIAVMTGAKLVPVFAFGENDVYSQTPNERGTTVRTWQEKIMRVFGFSTPFIQGRGVFQYTYGFMPYRRPIHVVVGKPIEVPKIADPTPEEVDKVHQVYLESLEALYHEHKDRYELAVPRKKSLTYI
eukprot:Clim_evm6s49 gene=Clim_evmTU6s49